MANPIDEALMAKEALPTPGPFRSFFGGMRGGGSTPARAAAEWGLAGRKAGQRLLEGGSMAVGGAAVAGLAAGIGAGVNQLLNASEKRRNFKEMLELNPDLEEYHKQNPRFFNASYSSIRRVAPQYGSDPVVAGSLMRRMMANPESAGTILTGVVKPPQVRDEGPAMSIAGELGPVKYKYGL